MTRCQNTHRLLALAGVGVFGLLTLVGSGGGGGEGGESTPTPKAWRTALLIETDNAGDAQRPQIAMDGAGNAFVVWMQSDGMRDNIWAKLYGVGTGTWGAAQLIETVDLGNAQFPQIAMDGSGNAHAVWQHSDGTRDSIWANRFSAGTWGAAQLIETDDVGDAFFPQIAMDGSGNAHAVWRQSDGVRFNIQANRFSAGNWGAAELIETDDTDHAVEPQIAVDGSGNAIAVWSQLGMEPNIEANRFAAGGVAWGFAQLIDTFSGPASNPQITFDASGNALAVWKQRDGTGFDNIWASRFSAGNGLWDQPRDIAILSLGHALFPQIAVDGAGNALAVWMQSDGMRDNIWANRFGVGTGTWGTAQLIETDDTGRARFPQIAFDGSGNALAVWQHSDGTRDSIWANRFDAGSGTWGTTQLIETDDTGDAQFPQIAFDGSGNAVAVWQQSDGMRINVWANRFE